MTVMDCNGRTCALATASVKLHQQPRNGNGVAWFMRILSWRPLGPLPLWKTSYPLTSSQLDHNLVVKSWLKNV